MLDGRLSSNVHLACVINMTEDVELKCKLFVKNRDIAKTAFQWASTELIPLCSYMYSVRGEHVDAVRIEECRTLLRQNIGGFSGYKGDMFYPMATLLSLHPRVEKEYTECVSLYKKLKASFEGKISLPIASFAMLMKIDKDQQDAIIKNALDIKVDVRNAGLAVEKEEESAYLMLAMAGKNKEEVIRNIRTGNDRLKELKLEDKTSFLVSVVLTILDSEFSNAITTYITNYNQFKKRQCSPGTGLEAVAIAMIPTACSSEIEIEKIIEISEYLKMQKGFGLVDISLHQRLMYSIFLSTAKKEVRLEDYLSIMIAMICGTNLVLLA